MRFCWVLIGDEISLCDLLNVHKKQFITKQYLLLSFTSIFKLKGILKAFQIQIPTSNEVPECELSVLHYTLASYYKDQKNNLCGVVSI